MVFQLLVALLLFIEPSFISCYNNQNEIEKLCFLFEKRICVYNSKSGKTVSKELNETQSIKLR